MRGTHERKEKICLNCQTPVIGRYCHVCGQENIEPKQGFWSLLSHFLSDLTHFDGKFFISLRSLIFRPGFLPRMYMQGRRAAFLNPIRMYLFTSAFFFLVFFALFSPKQGNTGAASEAVQNTAGIIDSINLEIGDRARQQVPSAIRDTPYGKAPAIHVEDSTGTFHSFFQDFSSREAYDSLQQQLPDSLRDAWWIRQLLYKKIHWNSRYGQDRAGMLRELFDIFLHKFPYLLFISLPLFAFFLKLLYIRHRAWYLVDHVIFLLYLYIYTFLFLLVYFAVNGIRERWGGGLLSVLLFIYVLYGIYYAYRSMRNFYGQSRTKTLIKFGILNLLAGISLLLLFVLFIGISVFQL